MLGAQGLDQLLVVGVVAVIGEDAKLRLTLLDRAGSLVQTTRQAVVSQRLLQDHLNALVDVHRLSGGSHHWRLGNNLRCLSAIAKNRDGNRGGGEEKGHAWRLRRQLTRQTWSSRVINTLPRLVSSRV